MGYIGSIYEKLDKLEKRIDALNHILSTEDDETERKEIEEELDKVYTEYHKLMDS
jgi:hypothetical protein